MRFLFRTYHKPTSFAESEGNFDAVPEIEALGNLFYNQAEILRATTNNVGIRTNNIETKPLEQSVTLPDICRTQDVCQEDNSADKADPEQGNKHNFNFLAMRKTSVDFSEN